jgi:two-component system, LytTR family, sensor kinase
MTDRSEKAEGTLRYPGIPLLLLLWTLVGALAYVRHYLQQDQLGHHNTFAPEFLTWLACFCPWAFLAPLVFRLEKQYPLVWKRCIRNGGLLVLASFGFSYVAYQSTLWASVLIQRLFVQPLTVLRPFWAIPKGELCLEQFLFWATVGAGYVVRHLMQLQEQERDKAELLLEKSRLEASLRQAELEALRLRLNPHFLFNTLQNVSMLAPEDPKTASQMLTRLGDLLRAALRSESQPETPLETEVRLTESYVAVEKMRFGDRLNVVFELAPGTSDALVPTLLLQPLVENAIRHGMKTISNRGVITIRSSVEIGQLVLTVKDNGQGLPGRNLHELQLGIGLGSTCERLARMYGAKSDLTLRRLSEGGTETRVTLPFRSPIVEKAPDEQAQVTHRR